MQPFGDLPLQFDREIRDALRRIDDTRRDDCPGRARIDAPMARPAMVRGEWLVDFELEIDEQ